MSARQPIVLVLLASSSINIARGSRLSIPGSSIVKLAGSSTALLILPTAYIITYIQR